MAAQLFPLRLQARSSGRNWAGSPVREWHPSNDSIRVVVGPFQEVLLSIIRTLRAFPMVHLSKGTKDDSEERCEKHAAFAVQKEGYSRARAVLLKEGHLRVSFGMQLSCRHRLKGAGIQLGEQLLHLRHEVRS
eukprot:6416772-Amphidinium_carterae.1